jgi:PAS domain S-box-containing protein
MIDELHSADLLKLVVDLSPAGMLVVDGRGTILLVNREIERQFGYSRDELVGQSVERLIPERLRGAHPTHRSRYVSGAETRPMGAGRDLHGRRKDGTDIPLEIGLNPIQTAGGILVLCMVVDITTRRMAETQLRQAQKMEAMGTLAGGIAHDFNNLLHGIVGHAELLQRDTRDRPELQADLGQIVKMAERGRQLVDRILTFSRHKEVARTPTPLERPMREAIELLRVSLPRDIEIRAMLDPATPMVRCDETQIHQVTVNLATNAAHAMGAGGVLQIRLEPGPHARLTVVDSGAGMSPEVLERVLEPFFTTKPPGKGTGLGLSLIHGIVQSLSGALDIASEPGFGTRVDVILPAATGAASPEAATAAEPSAVEQRPHVLVVEDEKDFAFMLRRQLEAFEYRATIHTSSLEALEDFRSRPEAFDALMTDNSMPKMSGVALARELRRIRPDLPVLLVSGTASLADTEELRHAGVTRTLNKPHSGREMDEALRAVLGRS